MKPAVDSLSNTFAALADPTRRAILERLSDGQTHVGDLAKPFRISGPAVSRHLRVLEQAGLIERRVEAQWRVFSVREQALHEAHDWIDQYRRFWEGSLDRLAQYLEDRVTPERAAARPRKPRSRD